MELTPTDIDAFIEAWRDAFEETLSDNEARTEASRLLRFYAFLLEREPSAQPDGPQSTTLTHEVLPILSEIQ